MMKLFWARNGHWLVFSKTNRNCGSVGLGIWLKSGDKILVRLVHMQSMQRKITGEN